ncbi:MAG: right-handed parallel beta-helix repeat-containing protein [Myxococcota bacterium]
MASFARPIFAGSGPLSLVLTPTLVLVPASVLTGCFADPPMVVEDDITDPTQGTESPGTTVGLTTGAGPTTATPTADDSTGPEPTSTGSTTGPDDSGSSSTGPDPMECEAPDGQPDPVCPLATPFCVGGSCAPCSAGGDCAAIDPTTPVCGPGDVCLPCVAHSECPGNAACHLFEGSCLPSDRVYYVDPDANCGPGDATEMMPACSIQEAFGAASGEPQVTIRLDEDVYFEDITISAGRVIAILGTGMTTIATIGGPPTVSVQGTAYLNSVDIQNFEDLATGILSSGDLWLDDSMVRNNEIGLSSTAGRVVLRRSRVLDSGGVGVRLAGGETARFINTIVANNGDPFEPVSGGIVSTASATIDVLYSTVVQNTGASGGAIDCNLGTTTVRNSIIASQTMSNAIDCLGANTVTYSVVADSEYDGEPTNVALMNYAALNLDGDYELAGGSVANDAAQWELGDPTTDINGAPRPAVPGTADYAGADLPN